MDKLDQWITREEYLPFTDEPEDAERERRDDLGRLWRLMMDDVYRNGGPKPPVDSGPPLR